MRQTAANVLRHVRITIDRCEDLHFPGRRGQPKQGAIGADRRTFREFLVGAGPADSGTSLCWYRRTGATVIARGLRSHAAAAFLGQTSTAITEAHYIERDNTVDLTPAAQLERTLRRGEG